LSEEERTIAVRFALVVGPTPGHVHPILALADAIRAEDASADVVLVGAAGSEVNRLIDVRRYRFETIPASPLARATRLARARVLVQVWRGFVAARRLLAREGTQMVMGFGSYASGAALLAARSLGLLTAVHEANTRPGLANRLLGRCVHRVYLGVEMPPAWWYVSSRARVVGTPVRADINALADRPRDLPGDRPVRVLVVGGAWGARFFAREIPPLIGRLARLGVRLDVWHQLGAESPDPTARAYEDAQVSARLMPYIDDMATAYRWADFVIARSGASVTSELALAGLPALLVPWAEAADDHQAENARAITRTGAGIWTSEAGWSCDRLASQILPLLTDHEVWRRASAAARSMARPDAAAVLARDALSLLAARR
jgi:UDP-N-acetylglucosamine--N-acetylmuramyl-(pentapeptide) pyrophosphoryl-undecaprenol N-acetylglucosamine transferase